MFVKIFVGLILFVVALFIISQLASMSIEAIILIEPSEQSQSHGSVLKVERF